MIVALLDPKSVENCLSWFCSQSCETVLFRLGDHVLSLMTIVGTEESCWEKCDGLLPKMCVQILT